MTLPAQLSGRLKLLLAAIALLPPLVLIALLYFQSETRRDARYREQATIDLRKVIAFRDQFRRDLTAAIDSALYSEWYVLANYEIGQSDSARVTADASAFGLDYLELTDIADRVVASSIDPGRIGQKVVLTNVRQVSARLVLSELVQQDSSGVHPVLAARILGDGIVNVYGGVFLDRRFTPQVDTIIRGTTRVILAGDSTADARRCSQMEVCTLTETGGRFEAVISGGSSAHFYMLAEFAPPEGTFASGWSLALMALTALVSGLISLGVRRYLTRRVERQPDSGRVGGLSS